MPRTAYDRASLRSPALPNPLTPLSTLLGCALALPTPQDPGAPAPQQQQPQEQEPEPQARTGRATRGDDVPEDLAHQRSRHHITGDWFGWHDWLERRGVEPRMALVTDASWLAAGGVDERSTALRSLLDIECDVDGGRLLGWHGARLYVDVQLQNGPDGSRDTGDFQVYSNIDGPNRRQLAQLFVEQTLFAGALRCKLGKSDANTDFAYVEHGLQHVHSSFGFAPTVLGLPTYPDPSFGFATFVEPGGNLHFAGGVYDGATQAGLATGPRGPRTLFGAPQDLFVVGELGMYWQRDGTRPGHFGLGAWRHTGQFARQGGGVDDGAQGYYLIADQVLWRDERAPDANGQLGAFVQYGFADPDVSVVEHYVGCGATWTAPFAQRPRDACGVGVAAALWRDRPGEVLQGTGEVAVELFYNFVVTDWLRFKPDLQWIQNPGGQPGVDDAWVLTLRIAMDL